MTDSSAILSAAEIRARHESRHGRDDDPDAALITALSEASQLHDDALEALHRAAGDRAFTASEQRKWDAHTREKATLDGEASQLERRRVEQRDADVAERRAKWGTLQVNPIGSGSDDIRGESPAGLIRRGHDVLDRSADVLSHDAADRLANAMTDQQHGTDAARIIVARSNPHYESAFRKLITAPDPSRAFFGFTAAEHDAFAQVEQVRSALTLTSGGALLPLSYDPNVLAITSDGSANPMRRLATVRTAIASPHRAVTTAGVTANWVGENGAISDGSPTFTGTEIELHKLACYVSASYELFQDAGRELMDNLPMILGDARDTAENAAFISGSGSGAPTGVITAISATVASTVTATTRGAFTSASTADVFALLNALPARSRQSSKAAVFAHNDTISKVRQMVVGTGGIPIVDVPGSVPSVSGLPWHEASSVASATTSGNILAVAGDFSRYLLVDHVAGPSLEFVQNSVDGDGKVTGTRGWVYWARTGGDSLDDARFRYLLA